MSNSDLVVKSNTLIDASFKLTLAEFRLLNLVFAEISNSPDGSDGFYNNDFKVTADQYSQIYEVDKSTAYEALKDASQRLFHRYFTYEGVAYKKPDFVEVIESRWVSKIKYSKQGGYVKLVLTDDVKSMVGVLQKCFTQYHLQHTVGLTSTYAKRLYEIMVRWRNAGNKTPQISLEDLRNRLGIEEGQYKQMNNFKRLVLDNAIEQINEHSDIKAEYEQIKEGRTIVGFVFRFKAKKVIEGKSKPVERDPHTIDAFTGQTDTESKNTPSWQVKGLSDAQIKKIGVYKQEFIDANTSKISPNDRRGYDEIFKSWEPLLKDPNQVKNFKIVQDLLERKRLN